MTASHDRQRPRVPGVDRSDQDAAAYAPGMALTEGTLATIWRDLQAQHPELPPAVFELSTSARSSGHTNVDWSARPVVLVAGPSMARRPPAEILQWVLHEAAHAMAEARSGPLSPSQQRRGWHTETFRDAATDLGLVVTQTEHFGWRDTELPSAFILLGPSLVRLSLATGHLDPPAGTQPTLPI